MNTFKTWGEIHPDRYMFKASILEIQEFATPREKSQKWARNLRFLTSFEQPEPTEIDGSREDDEELSCHHCRDYPYFNSPNPNQPSIATLRLTEPGELGDCTHYIAVSYCWRQPAELKRSVVQYDQPYTIYTRECIDQEDRLDQETGIQSMDLIYERSAAPLGLLQTYIDSQHYLDVLDDLDEGKDIDLERLKQAIKLLELISKDPWFTRAWILQESASSGGYMDLLVSTDIIKFHNDIVQKLVQSGLNATLKAEDEVLELCNQIERAKGRLPLHAPNDKWIARIPTYRISRNAVHANDYLAHCFNSRPTDRLAILANMCNSRVDVTDLRTKYGPQFKKLSEAMKHQWQEYADFLTKLKNPYELKGTINKALQQEKGVFDSLNQALVDGTFSRDIDEDVYEAWFAGPEPETSKDADLRKWEDEPALEILCIEIIWSVLHILSAHGLHALANAIWHSSRLKARYITDTDWKSIIERYSAQEEISVTLEQWVDENVHCDELPGSYEYALDNNPQELFGGRSWQAGSGRNTTRKINP
ncbi:hypothetical protein BGZ60DRAFT_538518 [Tricladium varicosporioides]|nr:hypothetical protein BGZ60DRAFT_538518 [Hymenoscyphus varicosporioides]